MRRQIYPWPLFPFRWDMVETNKDRLLMEAVIGEITHPAVESRYTTTWDGRPKLALGRGGSSIT